MLRPGRHIGFGVALGFGHAVAAELLQHVLSDGEAHHRLGHDGRRGNGGVVGTLVDGLGRLAGGDVDGAKRLWNGWNRLHRGTHHNRLAVGHAAFDSARTIAQTCDAAIVANHHFVVRLGAGTHRLKETVPDLHALDGLDAHDGTGQCRVQPAVRFNVRADSSRNAVYHDLDHAA